ncbi:MAG: hypothetical protein IJ576_03625 [Synergistaceae bacterium]|nr:hypothetical protein [Synergistaceae bacterium]MBR1603401.1 hypothetical protein [Synergistaceae bacterium]
MRREFCTVEKFQDASLILKNTLGEVYRIEKTLLKNFKAGDKVLLLYLDRTPLSEIDGEYSADVYAVYPDDNKLLRPAK